MSTAFEVLGRDHEEAKQIFTELELGLTAATGADRDHLELRGRIVRHLVVQEARHQAVEEMYFWPVVRERLGDGTELASQAQDQEREAKEILGELDNLTPEDDEFEGRLAEFIRVARAHIAFEETTVWPSLWAVLRAAESDDLGRRLEEGKRTGTAMPRRRINGAA
jgi:hemerythrin-like domain-containing protein